MILLYEKDNKIKDVEGWLFKDELHPNSVLIPWVPHQGDKKTRPELGYPCALCGKRLLNTKDLIVKSFVLGETKAGYHVGERCENYVYVHLKCLITKENPREIDEKKLQRVQERQGTLF